MAAPCPSEFLTFYRRIATSSTLKYRSVPRTSIRSFSSSICRPIDSSKQNTEMGGGPDRGGGETNKKHVLEKNENTNVQTANSKAARDDRANDSGGVATQQKGSEQTSQAKKEFPEAPDAIGFQDERGGKMKQ